MAAKVNRNALCPCGSGKKYKNCCGQEGKSSRTNKIILGTVIIAVLAFAGYSMFQSREKGIPEPAKRPPGDAPPGKVWSEEHGHWHDDASPLSPQPLKKTPEKAPPGKVWSQEHGHWHDNP